MAQIPAAIAAVFEELKKEVTWLHGRWIVYRQLFGTSERRIKLLNEFAPNLFFIVQDVLIGEVQVSLCKLTDPARTGKSDNLSLEHLHTLLQVHGDKALAASERVVLDAMQVACQPFRTLRNKRLAHLDLAATMQSTSSPLPGVSRAMVEDALKWSRDYMNGIERHYLSNSTLYEHFIMTSDGESLVTLMKYGMRYQELIADGTIPPSDWQKSPWRDA